MADGAGVSTKLASEAESEQTPMLQIETNAGDGSVWVDGEFRGESPTKLSVKPGVRTVKVVRDGYKVWKQKIVIHGDPLTLRVELEKNSWRSGKNSRHRTFMAGVSVARLVVVLRG